MTPRALVEQLAERHDAHLRWLHQRLHGRLAPDEVEDVLQAAYARALTAFSAPAPQRPRFAHAGQATAWLRTVALNHANDLGRERHGRPGAGRPARPADVSLDVAGSHLVADVDVEEEVVDAVQRDTHRSLVAAAIAALDPRHRQILQLRYGQELTPAAIMVLAGLDRRQWDGRHTRALKAFGRALSRLPISGECRATRTLLRVTPAAVLQGERGPAREHLASCLPCAAFSSAARFAAASLPLPITIEAWRLDALEVLTRASPDPGPARGPGEPVATEAPVIGGSAPTGALAGVLATVGALALAGLAVGGLGGSSPGEPHRAALESHAAVAARGGGTRLAEHLTERQRLERSARDMARRRTSAGRRRAAGARSAAAVPSRATRGPDTRMAAARPGAAATPARAAATPTRADPTASRTRREKLP